MIQFHAKDDLTFFIQKNITCYIKQQNRIKGTKGIRICDSEYFLNVYNIGNNYNIRSNL